MIYIIIENFDCAGDNNVWAGTDIEVLYKKVQEPRCMSFIEDEFGNHLCIEVFGFDGRRMNYVYLTKASVATLEVFKEALTK